MSGGNGSRLDPVAVLRLGAKVLQARQPVWNLPFKVEGRALRARFDWPGIVTVSDDLSGDVLARSLPGKPTEPDEQTLVRRLGQR